MSTFVRGFIVPAVAALCIVVSHHTAYAQGAASVGGVVTDPTGAAVTAARVDLMAGQFISRSAATDAEGRYRFDGVSPGIYIVRVTTPGFQRAEQSVMAAVHAAMPRARA